MNIVLFDGVCSFCDSSVQFMIKNDPQKHLTFGAFQSPEAQPFLLEHGIDGRTAASIVLVTPAGHLQEEHRRAHDRPAVAQPLELGRSLSPDPTCAPRPRLRSWSQRIATGFGARARHAVSRHLRSESASCSREGPIARRRDLSKRAAMDK